jgi:hypothetical protein
MQIYKANLSIQLRKKNMLAAICFLDLKKKTKQNKMKINEIIINKRVHQIS